MAITNIVPESVTYEDHAWLGLGFLVPLDVTEFSFFDLEPKTFRYVGGSWSLVAHIFVDPTGDDDTGDGTYGNPYETIAKGISEASAGETVFLKAGTYNVSSQVVVPVGISLRGEGETSEIVSDIDTEWTATLSLSSASEGTDGNQSISFIKMDGNNVAYSPIWVVRRSNVKIHHCTFVDFFNQGVHFAGHSTEPTTYATGNEFHDNIVENCAMYNYGTDFGDGCLLIGGQEGMLVYNNIIENNSREFGYNGYPIKYSTATSGFNKGLKIYGNRIIASSQTPSSGNNGYMFAIELWDSHGGVEIYDNVISGQVDIVRAYKGDYDFGVKIYDNFIGWDTLMPLFQEGEVGIHIEHDAFDIHIFRNHIKNCCMPLYFSALADQEESNIWIHTNIIENVGADTDTDYKGWGLRVDGATTTFDNWNIWNNIITGKNTYPVGGTTMYGLILPPGTTSNISIKNNIIQGFEYAGILIPDSPYEADYVYIENNIMYLNGAAVGQDYNAPRGTGTLNNSNIANNITGNTSNEDPVFVDPPVDFRLDSDSPGIGAGVDVGLTEDYDGNPWSDPPCIGAYQN